MERASARQIVLLGTAYAMNATLVSVPAQMVAVARQDALLAYLPAFGVVLASVWLLGRVAGRFPDQDLYGAMVGRFPVAGRVLAAGYMLFVLVILARDTRVLVDFVSLALLPTTPLLMISALCGLTMIQIARGGVEMLGRVLELFLPVLLITVYLVPLLMIKDFSVQMFQPSLEQGLTRPLAGAWYAVAYLGEVTLLPLFCSGRTFRFRQGALGLLLGSSALIVLMMVGIGGLGPEILARMTYPSYEVVRQVRATDFLDRLDLVFVGIWLPTMLTKLAMSLYAVCHGLGHVIPQLSVRLMVTPVGVFGIVCAAWFFENAAQVARVNRVWPLVALVFQLLLPVLFFFVLRPKQTKRPASV